MATDLQQFNKIVAVSLDEVKSFIDELTDILDPTFAKKETLPILAAMLNVTLNKNEDDIFQRRQIKTAVDLFKAKGTEEAFKALLYNIGFSAEVIPLWTADYSEEVVVTAPYIRIDNLVVLQEGMQEIYVVNPDEQYTNNSTLFEAV